MASSKNFLVRKMTRAEIDLAIDLAAKEGWNPGLHDASCFFATDPNGFFVGLLDGEPIGCISTVAYDHNFGFLGLYIVRPEFRGKGFGIQIWNHGMAYLGSRNIGLDGVVAQQNNYKKSGFKLAYRNIRYEGIANGKTFAGVTELAKIPLADLVAYDQNFFPAQRREFLQRWIKQPEGLALGLLQNQKLIGYGVIRACRNGFKIGPLFAENHSDAETLFQALTAPITGKPFYLDVPEVNPEAVALASRHNMKVVFETARMYTQAAPKLPLGKIFGVTTFEIG